jgi:hypothetical protein
MYEIMRPRHRRGDVVPFPGSTRRPSVPGAARAEFGEDIAALLRDLGAMDQGVAEINDLVRDVNYARRVGRDDLVAAFAARLDDANGRLDGIRATAQQAIADIDGYDPEMIDDPDGMADVRAEFAGIISGVEDIELLLRLVRQRVGL